MAKFEDLLERVRDLDEDLAAEFEEFSGSNLRKKAQEAESAIRERDELKAENERLKAAPQRRAAFEKAGVDFDALRKAERALLENYDGEMTEEALAEFIEENEFPVIEGSEEEAEETPAQEITRVARRGGGRAKGPTVLTPEDTMDWSTEKLFELREKDPDAYEALKRGESATLKVAI